jgi:hypothetical protein
MLRRKNPERARMSEVFISYSRHDQALAEAMAAQLGALGVDVWWDRDLLGGEDYRKKTAGVIAKVPAAIVLWSRRSVESEWVIGEASAARERKVLIPVNIDGALPPLDFRPLNTIDLTAWIPGDRLPETLVRAVGEKTGRAFGAALPAAGATGIGRLSKSVARSWYADFECLLFSVIAQGFAAVLTNIPLAIHQERLNPLVSAAIAIVNATVTAAAIMRPAVAGKRLVIAAPWIGVAVGTGLVGYYLTALLWKTLSINEFLTFVGFWSLGLVLVLDAARRSAPPA